jgi:hypothetical protein
MVSINHQQQFLARFLSLMTSIVAAMAIIGCNHGLEAEVSGIVTLDGRPIGPGSVVFAPAGAAHNPAIGSIQADGNYVLSTGRERGMLAGSYRVAVYIHEMPPGAKPTDRQNTTRSLIPQKYEDVSTSGLEFKVDRGRNKINLELTSST